MKFWIRSLLAFCLATALPFCSNAQKKKSATGPSAEDRQKLADAYDVLESLASTGQAKQTETDQPENGGSVSDEVFVQTDVKANREACTIEFSEIMQTYFDGRGPGNNPYGTYLVWLPQVDLRSLKVDPFLGKLQSPDAEGRFKKSYEGFVLKWSYLKLSVGELISRPGDGAKFALAGELFLSKREDADRAMKALAYAAKSCGAHETAF